MIDGVAKKKTRDHSLLSSCFSIKSPEILVHA